MKNRQTIKSITRCISLLFFLIAIKGIIQVMPFFWGLPGFSVGWKLLIFAMFSVLILANIVSGFCLFKLKTWGFWLGYLTVLYTSLFFSMSYIPFVRYIDLYVLQTPGLMMVVANVIILSALVYLHISLKKLGNMDRVEAQAEQN